MGRRVREHEQIRKAGVRSRIVQHYEQITRNASRTCRFFGVSRTQFCIRLRCVHGSLAGGITGRLPLAGEIGVVDVEDARLLLVGGRRGAAQRRKWGKK